uniref:C2H2-type domain-containing protein n=1 Tax=Phlebotomus papatasi TaxID=29031 RepID=A0A1B0D655_PHLPP
MFFITKNLIRWRRFLALNTKDTLLGDKNVMDIKEELNENVQPQTQPRKKKRKHGKHGVVRVKNYSKAISCTFCDRIFFKLKQLRNHLKKKHFSEAFEAEQHPYRKSIKPVKPKSCKPKVKIEPKKLSKNSIHNPYQCDICYQKFSKEKEINNHILENHVIHSEDGSHKMEYICPFCDQSFPRKVTLSAHLKRKHIRIKPISCIHCGTEFKSHELLSKHFRVCSKLFHCEICQVHFNTLRGLKRHCVVHFKNPTPTEDRNGNGDTEDTLSATEMPEGPSCTVVQEKPQSSQVQEIQQPEEPMRVINVYFVECKLEAYIEDMQRKQNKN